MITIDRSSNKPVHEQLVEQLRYLIASGHFKIDQTLPSTRGLAEQVGVSFHTVRKAYQHLEREGRLEARVGSGYRVVARAPLEKGQRIERGAAIVQEALQHLIGLGLHDDEIEYLFQEQLDLLHGALTSHKLLFVAPYREMAELSAEQLAHALQQRVEPATPNALGRHQDADYVVAPFDLVQPTMGALPRADVLGVQTYLSPSPLDTIARLLPHETLGLVTRYSDAVEPLMNALRAATGFNGQTLATSIDRGAGQLEQLFRQTDLLVYTPPCRRRLLALLDEDQAASPITPLVSQESITRLRQVVPA
jgi:GntR family transcriptional regulator